MHEGSAGPSSSSRNVHLLACRFEELRAAAERAERHYARRRNPGRQSACRFRRSPCTTARCRSPSASLELTALLERSPDQSARAAVTAVLGGLCARSRGAATRGVPCWRTPARSTRRSGTCAGLRTILTPVVIALETIAGDQRSRRSRGRESVRSPPCRRRPRLRQYECAAARAAAPRPRRDWSRADELVGYAEREALPSDVLVQFWWRSARARLLARSGDVAEAETMARDCGGDRLPHRRLARAGPRAPGARRGAPPRRAPTPTREPRLSAARTLLRRKGATALGVQSERSPARGSSSSRSAA